MAQNMKNYSFEEWEYENIQGIFKRNRWKTKCALGYKGMVMLHMSVICHWVVCLGWRERIRWNF
jgi:hypothetical protein